MIWLLLIIAIGLIILGYYLGDSMNGAIEMLGIGIAVTSVFACIAGFVFAAVILFSYPYNVDKKIDMYMDENKQIEEKVKETVRVYMNYEQETYNNLVKNTDLTTLLVAYPDLNSNELVKSEINLYVSNNDKIKELKEAKINRRMYRFWLYFGK